MRSLAFSGLALAALTLAAPFPVMADSGKAGVGAPPVILPGSVRPPLVQPLPGAVRTVRPRGPLVIRPGHGGGRYVAPHYGFQLPRIWIAPTYYIANYGAYGLPRPAPGFGWSRYYDDAVLTDQWGRVYDARSGLRWDRALDDERFDDERGDDERDRRGGSGVGGAVVGGVVGGVAGNVIAGSGNRLAGTLIGGGLGALAGQAIDKDSRKRRDRDRYERDGSRGGYEHGWSTGPHWGGGSWSGSGSWSSGYDVGGTTVTTVVIQPSTPVVHTRYVTSYEYVHVPVKRRVVKRHYRPRPKPKCVC